MRQAAGEVDSSEWMVHSRVGLDSAFPHNYPLSTIHFFWAGRLFLLLAAALGTALWGPIPAAADEVVLTTGIVLRGRVLRANEGEVVVQTEDGRQVQFPRPRVARITLIPPAVLRLANDLQASARYAAAADAYQHAAAVLEPGVLRERARVALVNCLLATGEEARAVEAFLDLVSDSPDSYAVPALPLFGGTLNDPAGVLVALKKREAGISNDRARLVLRALQFWAHLALADEAQAARAADDLGRDDHPDARSMAAVCRGWRQFRSGRPAEAAEGIERVRLRLTPFARPHAEVLLAQCYGDQGKQQEGLLAALRVAFGYEEYPHLAAEGLYLAGERFAALKQPDRALAMFRQLVKVCPASTRAAQARRRIEELDRLSAPQAATVGQPPPAVKSGPRT